MAIEESKIIDLIAAYEGYEKECRYSSDTVDHSRASLYRTVIKDLESLLPRKSIADLSVSDYNDLTGTIVEHDGRRGVLLGGQSHVVVLFTFADKNLTYDSPDVVYLLDEPRFWDGGGAIPW